VIYRQEKYGLSTIGGKPARLNRSLRTLLLKCDASALEWRVKVFLSQDKVGMKEILNGEDTHANNQEEFKLPTRLISKVFVYRMIFADAFGEMGYRGPAYAYANDPDFMPVSQSPKFWEKVIERFFEKYKGIHEHSINLIREATTNGKITSPSGRFYRYSPKPNRHGTPDWPRTEILNHLIQGLSADFVQVARILLWSQLNEVYTYKHPHILLINTVHDDLELDILDKVGNLCYNICLLLEDCFKRIPERFEKMYGVPVNVPMAGESSFGMNMAQMVKFNRESFKKDFEKICYSELM
jgi:DNA polymerase I-like protein with 3'-5' exonuclease and polymerase domains